MIQDASDEKTLETSEPSKFECRWKVQNWDQVDFRVVTAHRRLNNRDGQTNGCLH